VGWNEGETGGEGFRIEKWGPFSFVDWKLYMVVLIVLAQTAKGRRRRRRRIVMLLNSY
jgi:hypothetical protein